MLLDVDAAHGQHLVGRPHRVDGGVAENVRRHRKYLAQHLEFCVDLKMICDQFSNAESLKLI